jgi:soluble lytic murein transglycosylase-like protein
VRAHPGGRTGLRTRPYEARAGFVTLAALCLMAVTAGSAEADLVFLTTGRFMSVKSYQVDGDAITLSLRAGGTLSLPRSAVARIAPDEVPYPEPAAAQVAGALPVSAAAKTPGLESKPFADLISTVATTHGVDAKLVHAVVEAESNYQAKARSPKGARGLMQLMPDTARQYAVKDAYDPRSNLDAGVRHLKDLLSRFDLRLALAAYNAGEGMVRKHGGMPPFAETRSYVRRILQRVGS